MPRGSQPGERRGGRKKGTPNKVTAEIRTLAARNGPQHIKELERIASQSDSDDTRLKAIGMLLDRGYGKAPQPLTGEGGEGPAKMEITWLSNES